jgi:hypothetical protein
VVSTALEPYATNYEWSAMLDPYELGEGVEISDVRSEEPFGRPAVAFVARAVPGYAPVCSCCPLVFSEVSQRLEHGSDLRAELGSHRTGWTWHSISGSASSSAAGTAADGSGTGSRTSSSELPDDRGLP